MIYQLYEYSFMKHDYVLVDTFDDWQDANRFAEINCVKGHWYIREVY